MALIDRICRLENRGGECPECGWGARDMEVEVRWYDGWGEDKPPDKGEETTYCAMCGMPDNVVIRWHEQLHMTPEERRQHEASMRRLREDAPLDRSAESLLVGFLAVPKAADDQH